MHQNNSNMVYNCSIHTDWRKSFCQKEKHVKLVLSRRVENLDSSDTSVQFLQTDHFSCKQIYMVLTKSRIVNMKQNKKIHQENLLDWGLEVVDSEKPLAYTF